MIFDLPSDHFPGTNIAHFGLEFLLTFFVVMVRFCHHLEKSLLIWWDFVIILGQIQWQMMADKKYTIIKKFTNTVPNDNTQQIHYIVKNAMPNVDTQQIHYQWKNKMPNDDSKEIHKWWSTTNTWSGAPASNRWLREAESGRPCLVHRSKYDDEENCVDNDGDDVGNDNVVDGLGLPVFTHDAKTQDSGNMDSEKWRS